MGTAGSRVDYWLHQGKAIPMAKSRTAEPPWPKRDPTPPLPPQPEVSTALGVKLFGFGNPWKVGRNWLRSHSVLQPWEAA